MKQRRLHRCVTPDRSDYDACGAKLGETRLRSDAKMVALSKIALSTRVKEINACRLDDVLFLEHTRYLFYRSAVGEDFSLTAVFALECALDRVFYEVSKRV